MAWTNEQKLAIDTRDRTLLVSAAAGSGKTATLTERIIQSILDEENPLDIGRMLIVTYTNAAVDELRERVEKKIKEAAAAAPDNKRLEEQLLRIKDAGIMTITAFCNTILRSCAESIGLSPNYRIAEPAEVKIISSSILEGLINAAYEGELTDVCTSEEFIKMADSLSSVKHSEELSESLFFVFDKLKSSKNGINTLSALVDEYDPEKFVSPEKTGIGGYIFEYVKGVFGEYISQYGQIVSMASADKQDVKNLDAASSDISQLQRFVSAADYTELRDKLAAYSGGRISRPKDGSSDFTVIFAALHDLLVADVKSFNSKFFTYTADEWRTLYGELYSVLSVLYRFLKRYGEELSAEKKRRNICEFADIERYAYEALYDEDGNKTPLAAQLRASFDAVYVDEYQDVNALQSSVFDAISRDDNRFMVGDIKQSIYGFRSARPEIFATMKSEFPPLGSAGDRPAASIFMSKNFRCDECVVDFVNGIFDTFFGLLGKSIGYEQGDRLEFAKIYPEGHTPLGIPPEVHLVEKEESDSAPIEESEEDEAEDAAEAHAEARCIVAKIEELLASGRLASGERIRPGDIAVLMRSVKGKCAAEITRGLSALGVQVSVVDTGSLFLCDSVLLALSFLYVIDNPLRDIYLTALMCSPLFSFTPDEIIMIKRECEEEGTLWGALVSYIQAHPEYERGVYFVSELIRYRRLAEGTATDLLLSLIYRESGLMALAAKNGGRENLMLLHSFAKKFEQSDFKGLYSFICYVNDIIEKGEEFGAADSNTDENAVRLMTVHKSKGLEFPVCILANASSQGRPNTEKIALAENFGISLRLRDSTGLAVVDNPTVNIINHFISRGEYEEELRVLYVALTRAREQLYVYGTCRGKDADKHVSRVEALRELRSGYFITKAKTFMDMVLVGKTVGRLIIDAPSGAYDTGACEISEADGTAITDKNITDASDADAAPDTPCVGEDAQPNNSVLRDEYVGRFTFVNPSRALESFPEKVSVSRLTPTLLDESEEHTPDIFELLADEGITVGEARTDEAGEEDGRRPVLPPFFGGTDSDESARRGIATHTVMQFCDFAALQRDVSAELQRITERGFISDADAARVRKNELVKFTRSALFAEIEGAARLYREFRFNVKLPAERFTESPERKKALAGRELLVQGVIDCIIEDENGELHLVDYKTDRLTREELACESLAEARLISAHSRQLSYYADAIALMFGKRPSKIGIYSLHLGREIELRIDNA